MKISILSIGDELLKGTTLNRNLSIMGCELKKIGIIPELQLTIKDDKSEIKEAIRYLTCRSDIIISTGGLGPTSDDITVEVFAEFGNVKLVENLSVVEQIQKRISSENRPLSKYNLKQALIPESGKVLKNENGTAPGIEMDISNTKIFLLPGPPSEMEPIFKRDVVSYILSLKETEKIHFSTIYAANYPESELQKIVAEKLIPDPSVNVAYRVAFGVCEITLSGFNKFTVETEYCRLKNTLGNIALKEDAATIQEELYHALEKNNLTISFAESCTGGMLSSLITEISGISSFFKGSVIAYENCVKTKILNVKAETIEQFGAVSSECAVEMVNGIVALLKTDIGISVTGIAGPLGGTIEKPVGTLFIAVKVKDLLDCKRYFFTGNRERVRQRSTIAALDMARKMLRDS